MHRLNDRQLYYYEKVANIFASYGGILHVQLNTNMFNPSDPISNFKFFDAFKQTCDSNRIHEGGDVCCVKDFMTKSAAASLASHFNLKTKRTWKSHGT